MLRTDSERSTPKRCLSTEPLTTLQPTLLQRVVGGDDNIWKDIGKQLVGFTDDVGIGALKFLSGRY
jgi:hypothetical protein